MLQICDVAVSVQLKLIFVHQFKCLQLTESQTSFPSQYVHRSVCITANHVGSTAFSVTHITSDNIRDWHCKHIQNNLYTEVQKYILFHHRTQAVHAGGDDRQTPCRAFWFIMVPHSKLSWLLSAFEHMLYSPLRRKWLSKCKLLDCVYWTSHG